MCSSCFSYRLSALPLIFAVFWYVSVEFGVFALRVVRFELFPLTSMWFGVFGCVLIESGVVWSVFSFVYASNSIIIQQRPIEVETKWLNQARFDLCLNILDNH